MSERLLENVPPAEATSAKQALAALDPKRRVRACSGDARVALPLVASLLTLLSWPDQLIRDRQKEQAWQRLAAFYQALGTMRDRA